jgi:hypothetical protein
MRFVLALVLALTLAGAARAGELEVTTVPAAEDVSLPFWCDWSYDWEERCYRDDSERLGVGGIHDSVWRAALRFSLASLPPGSTVVTAELGLWYDRTCVASRRTTRPCDGRGFELEAHPIFTSRWLSEREVEYGPAVAIAGLEPLATPQWLVWDLTDLVADWASAGMANDGVLLKLVDAEEDLDAPGPAFASSTYADPALRPRLTVWYVPP